MTNSDNIRISGLIPFQIVDLDLDGNITSVTDITSADDLATYDKNAKKKKKKAK